MIFQYEYDIQEIKIEDKVNELLIKEGFWFIPLYLDMSIGQKCFQQSNKNTSVQEMSFYKLY